MMKNYETEARERWGDTAAYREHEQKTKNYTKEKWAEANEGMMAIADEPFKKNIEKYADGTAEFTSAAISKYCKGLNRK